MFITKAKTILNINRLILQIVNSFLGLCLGIVMLLQAFRIIQINTFVSTHNVNPDVINVIFTFMFTISISLGIAAINLVESAIVRKICYRRFYIDVALAVKQAKLPKKLPKVIYVYTAHNDFIPARMLQNMKQTYKNVEYWISDGSTNKQKRQIVRDFAKKYHVNLYQFPENSGGSKDKADNLNHFLRHKKLVYDYLAITDADEVLHPQFLEKAIPCFYSKKFIHLGAITPINQTYRSKGLYTNSMRCLDNAWLYIVRVYHNIMAGEHGGVSSCSAVISRKVLDQFGGFPDGALEDWYLEAKMLEWQWYGFYSPLTTCYQEYDISIKSHYARVMRVNDWIVRWFKTDSLDRFALYNNKYGRWYNRNILLLLFLPIVFAVLGLGSFLLWVLINFWPDISMMPSFYGLVATAGLLLVCMLATNTIATWGISPIKDAILFPFFMVLYVFSSTVIMSAHWIKAVILSIYPVFGGSVKQGSDIVVKTKNRAVLYWIIFAIIGTCLLIVFNVCYFLLLDKGLGVNCQFLPLAIVFNIFIGWYTIGCYAFLFMLVINKIPTNKNYKQSDFLDFKKYPVLFKGAIKKLQKMKI